LTNASHSKIKTGVLERTGNGSITEGIGQGRVTANLDGAPIDDAVHVEDHRSIEMVFIDFSRLIEVYIVLSLSRYI